MPSGVQTVATGSAFADRSFRYGTMLPVSGVKVLGYGFRRPLIRPPSPEMING